MTAAKNMLDLALEKPRDPFGNRFAVDIDHGCILLSLGHLKQQPHVPIPGCARSVKIVVFGRGQRCKGVFTKIAPARCWKTYD